MKLRYVGPYDAVVFRLPDGTPVEVTRNHQVEVPDELGARLIEQEDIWREVAPRKSATADETAGNKE